MRLAWTTLVAVGAASCLDVAPGDLAKTGRIEGQVGVSPGTRGDAYLFLYPRTPGAPREAAVPRYVTAVPDARLSAGDGRYVFGAVQPNPYRVGAFLDSDGNFQADIDVLSQPGAGDRVGPSSDLNLQPGERLAIDLELRQPVPHEPPAFRLDDPSLDEVVLPDQPGLFTLGLELEPLQGTLAKDRLAFLVSLFDEDGNGVPDDLNGDGIPDLSPEVLLRFLPRPGQTVPTDRAGRPATVVVPLAFNPAPFLTNLAGDLEAVVAVDRLQVFLIPQAQAVTYEIGKGRVVTPMDAIPVGAYELVLLARSGQYWRIPNDLAKDVGARAGGPYPGQGVRFRFVHGSVLDGGF